MVHALADGEISVEEAEKIEKLKALDEENGFVTPTQVIDICDEPEKMIDKLEGLIDEGVSIENEGKATEAKPKKNKGNTILNP